MNKNRNLLINSIFIYVYVYHKLSSTMNLNIPTSREYGHFTLSTTRNTSPMTTISKDRNIDSKRYQFNSEYIQLFPISLLVFLFTFKFIDTNSLSRHPDSPRPMTRISDYLNDKPTFPLPYVSPSSKILK